MYRLIFRATKLHCSQLKIYPLAILGFVAVVFNEDDPKPGYVTLFLKVPGLKVNKPLFGKAKPKNADIKDEFTSE